MNYEQEINDLKKKVANLSNAFIQAQKNQTPITAKTDESANKLLADEAELQQTGANLDYVAMMTDVEIPTEEGI